MTVQQQFIIDETGEKFTHHHGVTARRWFELVELAIILLSKPAYRATQGIFKLKTNRALLCGDPDCCRVNRRVEADLAMYFLIEDIQPVHPLPDSSAKERRICEGHPFKKGSYLCRKCAIVATAKRLVEQERKYVP
jgi:hypothetical protein